MSTTKYRTCHLCEAMCGLEIEVEQDQVLAIRGDKQDPFSRGHICPKAVALQDLHEDPDRLKLPLRRKGKDWEEISWEAAFDEAADRIRQLQATYGRDAVGIYQGNPSVHNLGTMLFGRGLIRAIGTRNRFSATSVDQLPQHVAAELMFGHILMIPIPDIDRTDHFLILGGNPMVSNGSLMTAPDIGKRLRAIRERGGKVVVVDPRRTETARKADEHHFIRPGTDSWLLLAMVHELFAHGWVQQERVLQVVSAAHLQELERLAGPYTPEVAAARTGIPAAAITALTKDLAKAPRGIIYGRMGVSTVAFGGLNHWLINCINILTGNLDREGGVMFTSPAAPLFRKVGGKKRFDRYRSRVRNLPELSGDFPVATLADEILTPGQGQVRGVVTICGNPVLSTPNGKRLEEALGTLDFMLAVDIYLNETTRFADIILPPATGLETAHYDLIFHHLAIRNTAKYSEPTLPKSAGAKFDWEILVELQKRLEADRLPDDEVQRQRMLMQYYLTPELMIDHQLKTGGRGLDLKTLQENPHGVDLGSLEPCLAERFTSDFARVALVPELFVGDLVRLEESAAANGAADALLIGRRDLRSNNSWMHNSRRLVKGNNRCTLLIHPETGQALGLQDGETAEVTSAVGRLQLPVTFTDDLMPGVVSIPHGWGHHRPGIRQEVAAEAGGVSVNDLTDEQTIDTLTGNAVLNGVPVSIKPL